MTIGVDAAGVMEGDSIAKIAAVSATRPASMSVKSAEGRIPG
jgi:hypothetical protein